LKCNKYQKQYFKLKFYISHSITINYDIRFVNRNQFDISLYHLFLDIAYCDFTWCQIHQRNILCTAFTLVDPKNVKIQYSHQYLFTLLVYASVKAVLRMLMNLTPGVISPVRKSVEALYVRKGKYDNQKSDILLFS